MGSEMCIRDSFGAVFAMAGLRVPDAVGWDYSGPPERNGGNGAVCRVWYVSQAGVGRNGCACRGSGRYCRCSREGPECTVLFVAVSLAFGSAHSVRCCSHAAWACAVRVSCPGDDAVDSAGKIREGVPRAVPLLFPFVGRYALLQLFPDEVSAEHGLSDIPPDPELLRTIEFRLYLSLIHI